MTDKRSTEWFWGEPTFDGNFHVFETVLERGGYKCLFCNLPLNKRLDSLKNHMKACKKKPADFKNEDIETIPRIKIRCTYCTLPLDMTGAKEARHLKNCKGFKDGREVTVTRETKKKEPSKGVQAREVIILQTNEGEKVNPTKIISGLVEGNMGRGGGQEDQDS